MSAPTIPYSSRVSQNTQQSIGYRAFEAMFGSGYSQSVKIGINDQSQNVTLVIPGLTIAELTILKDFFNSLGAHSPFSWQPPTESAPMLWKLKANDESALSIVNSAGVHFTLSINAVRTYSE